MGTHSLHEDIKFMPIRVSTLRGDKAIPFNAYVRVAGKYILFCKEGDSFEGSRLERLKTKKLQKMYLAEKDVLAYENYLRENIEKAYSNSDGKPIEIRAQVIHGSLQAAAEDLIEDPASDAFYKVALDGAKRFREFFFDEIECLGALLKFPNLDFSLTHHGVVAAAVALAVAEEIRAHNDRAMEMDALIVGAMIHDIENHYNHINLSLPFEKLNVVEKEVYNLHAKNGQKRLSEHAFYSPLIVEFVGHHDERTNGSGPQGKKEKDVDPLVFVLATANEFDHLILHGKLSIKDALKILLIDKMGLLPLDVMRGLQSALKKRNLI